jgi:thiamine-monophosphate kinase
LHPVTVADVGEHALIASIRSRLTMPSWVVVGPGDDAAVLRPERGALEVVTTDAQVEGVHFDRRFVPPDAIGHRALAVNLSDMAAMGARPRAALLSLILPDSLAVEALDRMLDGLLSLSSRYGTVLVGGNITRSPGPLVVDVTVMGAVRPRRALTRSGARPGDIVYVTGSLGDAAIGLKRLQASVGSTETPTGCDVERFLRPEPRIRAGILLGQSRAATSCMDLSDGLADAASQIGEASGVGIVLDADALPVSSSVMAWHAKHGGNPIDTALSAGEDYELLFTVRPRKHGHLRGVRQQAGDLPITRIGVVTKSRDLLVAASGDTRVLPAGFQHFR